MSSGPEGLDWQALVVELNGRRAIPNYPTSIGVFAFRGRELLPGTIVIDAVHQVRA